MTLCIPSLLEDRLRLDRALRSVVDDALTEFDDWLRDSKVPFFPDYTDHGPAHLSGVLATATALITPGATLRFSAADAAVLILATLLHDSAMHLSEAGFWELIRGSFAHNRVKYFDDSAWPELWEDFLFSAKRWDGRQLTSIFGETADGDPRAYVHDPFDSWDNLSEANRRLIGEFIRRYHPRLAHEFAIFGIPGHRAKAIELSGKLSPQLRDIAGLVARSHGLPARACLDYLSQYHHRRETQNCHAVYLMTLLRVADYLQVDASRSPAVVFRYKHIPSKTSQVEHRSHQAVTNITTTGDDPESIEIQAEPKDAATYLRLKEWLVGMQTEFDASWAVLGEVYGSQSDLTNLGLRFRRVRSNLDDVNRFARGVTYLPQRIRFDVARSELLKLLIRPLYGGNPSVGIRELIQNSVDAVRELREMKRQHPALESVVVRKQDADVEIWLNDPGEDGFATLTITDKGIGMDANIVRDYFLRAGASFRQSERWKEMFESPTKEGVQSDPRSLVLRSGRFGVGVLAAFLLGDSVRVLTRHARASEGLEFQTTLEADVIEVRKVQGCPVGTQLQVRVPREAFEELVAQKSARVSQPALWDWYQFAYPSVLRLLGRRKEVLENSLKTDVESGSIWNKLPTDLPYAVYWSFVDAPALSCNGIFVRDSNAIRRYSQQITSSTEYSLSHPNIAVLDPDARFPLTLQRDRFDGESYPFLDRLAQDVVEYSFAQLLRHLPHDPDLRALTTAVWKFAHSAGFYFGHGEEGGRRTVFESGLVLNNGILQLYNNTLFKHKDTKQLLLLGEPDDARLLPLEHGCDAIFWIRDFSRFSANEPRGDSRIFLTLAGSKYEIAGLRVASKYITWARKVRISLFSGRGIFGYDETRFRELFSVDVRLGNWCVVATNGCPATTIDWSYLNYSGNVQSSTNIAAVEVFLKDSMTVSFSPGAIARLWHENFRSEGIPLDPKLQPKTLLRAKDRLARFFQPDSAIRD